MSSASQESWRSLIDDDELGCRLVAVWGKSGPGGSALPLLQHLFDAMAVAELMWDEFIAPCLRTRFDHAAGGNGRRLYMWLCGLHDVGKATPAFQFQPSAPEQAPRVRVTGLDAPGLTPHMCPGWRHEKGSARILIDLLRPRWKAEAVDWIWPMVGGHHGIFHDVADLNAGNRAGRKARKARLLHGDQAWAEVQESIVRIITEAAAFDDLDAVQPAMAPSRADQLAWSGFVVMADWVASMSTYFGMVGSFADVGLGPARARASRAWGRLGLRRGWGEMTSPSDRAGVFGRFSSIDRPRPVQELVVDMVSEMRGSGLVVVEAPTGEGKTEAALAAAEVLAARFGADGVFVGLPTQATSDPMFDRVGDWLEQFGGALPIALLHGRRLFHDRWQQLEARARTRATRATEDPRVDQYGIVDDLVVSGVGEDQGHDDEDLGLVAIEWMAGRHRGLLAPNAVGTIDQLLFAGTRTKYVMLRYAGLAGKVVILDEIHAVDVYMAQFLTEVLEWLGQGRVPVVLLSATLAPGQRQELVDGYLRGALGRGHQGHHVLPAAEGYPTVLAACVDDDEPVLETAAVEPAGPNRMLEVQVVEEAEPAGFGPGVVELLKRDLVDGGCALVIHNTVARAQATFAALRQDVDWELVLLHARLTVRDRTEAARALVERLGPGGDRRPRWELGETLVIVATQVAEQSFDVDVDLLVTDHAPVDLLVQRAGRMHRHDRPVEARPPRLRAPRIVVTGVESQPSAPPRFPRGSEFVYGRHLLLRSWPLVERASTGDGWSMPGDVPSLVAQAYGDGPIVPDAWTEDARAAAQKEAQERECQRSKAQSYVLTRPGTSKAVTLAGLNLAGLRTGDVERHVRVRDGEEGEEVVLLRSDDRGLFTLDWTRLGLHGEEVRSRHGKERRELLLTILGGTVRVPYRDAYAPALDALRPLPEWREDPWLGRQKVAILGSDHRAALGDSGWTLSYDAELGLKLEQHR